MSAEHGTPGPVLDLRQRLDGARHGDDNGAEAVSPELVLVDPDLAARARSRLPERVHPEQPPYTPPVRRRAWPNTRAAAVSLVLAAALVTLVVAVLTRDDSSSSPSASAPEPALRVRGEARSAPARARSTPARPRSAPARARSAPTRAGGTPRRSAPTRTRPARARRERSARTRRRAEPARRASRTFVWVPVDGAAAYEVQFFRGARRVLLTRTARPRLAVPAASRGGRAFSLAPGTYRWYVWPLFRTGSGLRRGDAVVQATLDVPR